MYDLCEAPSERARRGWWIRSILVSFMATVVDKRCSLFNAVSNSAVKEDQSKPYHRPLDLATLDWATLDWVTSGLVISNSETLVGGPS